MAKAPNINSHDGAAKLGRGKVRDLNANAPKQNSGKGGKVGTAAGVDAFEAASRKPGRPDKLQGRPSPKGSDAPRGKDAGGTENMKADGHRYRGDGFHAPSSGRAHSKPAGVHSVDGVSTPKGVAKKPK